VITFDQTDSNIRSEIVQGGVAAAAQDVLADGRYVDAVGHERQIHPSRDLRARPAQPPQLSIYREWRSKERRFIVARQDQAHPDNVDGAWFVDTRCIRCDAARHLGPGHDRHGCQRPIRHDPPNGHEDTAELIDLLEVCSPRTRSKFDEVIRDGLSDHGITADVGHDG